MSSLQGGRSITVKLEKRAVIGKDKLLEIINKAIEEKIMIYMLIFAYEGKEYSIGCGLEAGEVHCGYSDYVEEGEPNLIEFSSPEELIMNLPVEHEVTALFESFYHSGYQSVITCDIETNYLLKDLAIGSDDPKYTYNTNEEIEQRMKRMQEEAKKSNKAVYIFLAGCVIFLVLFFTLMTVFHAWG